MNTKDAVKYSKSLLYFKENRRLATFKSWPFSKNKPCSSQKMAEAGFVFIGNKQEPDSVKCFYCDKHLNGWNENDDPWKKHLTHSITCHFAQLQNSQKLLTGEEFWTLKSSFISRNIKNFYNQKLDEAIEDAQDILRGLIKIIN